MRGVGDHRHTHEVRQAARAHLAHDIRAMKKALTLKLRQGLPHRLSDDLPLTDQALIGGIGQLENMAGLAQQGHEPGSLLKHQGKKLMFRGAALFLALTIGKHCRRGFAARWDWRLLAHMQPLDLRTGNAG